MRNLQPAMIYALLTKREVKMAGYWQSSFLHFYGPRRGPKKKKNSKKKIQARTGSEPMTSAVPVQRSTN